jgi:phosphoesterase RecJ-like protein
MNNIGIKEAAAFLLGCDGYLIYCHASPDGDTLGSATALALALRKLGKKTFVFSVDGIPQKLSFLPTKDIFLEREPEDLSPFTLVSVDVAGPRMLGNANNKNFATTLVIYHDDANADGAQVIANTLGQGQVRKNDGSYLTKGDFLVIIGSDWN